MDRMNRQYFPDNKPLFLFTGSKLCSEVQIEKHEDAPTLCCKGVTGNFFLVWLMLVQIENFNTVAGTPR